MNSNTYAFISTSSELMWNVRKEIKWNIYWKRVALGEYMYRVLPSWRRILMEKCKCFCWVERYVQRTHLLNWSSTHCWCIRDEMSKERAGMINMRHWMEGSIPYRKFMSAKARCDYPKNTSYYRYGWRGIKFLRESFEDFWRDMKDSYYEHVKQYGDKNTTLDRIDNNWDYCKENCRWATWDEQHNNMSNNHHIVYKWKYYPSISLLAKDMWKKESLIRDRIRNWWTIEESVDTPLLKFWENHVKKKHKL